MDLKSQYLKLLINIYVTIILAHQCYNFLINCSLQLQSVLAEVIQFVMSIKCSDQFVLKIEFWTLVSRKLLIFHSIDTALCESLSLQFTLTVISCLPFLYDLYHTLRSESFKHEILNWLTTQL